MDRVRSGAGGEVDRGVLELLADADPVGVLQLVGERVAHVAGLPAVLTPLLADQAPHGVRAGVRAPVDRAALEDLTAADPVGKTEFIAGGTAEGVLHTGCLGVLGPDGAIDRVGAAEGFCGRGSSLDAQQQQEACGEYGEEPWDLCCVHD